ncbi:unnamed protein product [Soboliphyme baturini]|uniref:Dynein light chain n=1 Tax=Soboliphyme baturini TaxID=241478 RepID=A0A183IJV4_9BILA|nr:unnamed protein product [Soboliphyme baturini]
MSQYTQKDLKLLLVDMKEDMLKEAIVKAEEAIDKFKLLMEIAEFIKTSFDSMFLPPWHVIVGQKFGSRVTHEIGTLAYFILGNMAFFIFRGLEE